MKPVPQHNSFEREPALTADERALFGPRKTGFRGMPAPKPIVLSLALSAVEIMDGRRSLDQIATWITEPVVNEFKLRLQLQAQRKAIAKDNRSIPHTVGRTRLTSPADGVVEATVLVHSRVKTKAVAVRLESIDHRWRATALSVI